MIGKPEQLNQRLGNVEFLGSVADRQFFHELLHRIAALSNSQDNIALPDAEEPYAWRRAYKIWYELRMRADAAAAAIQTTPQQTMAIAATERSWASYLRDHQQIETMKARGELTASVAEYLGLQEDDFECRSAMIRRRNVLAADVRVGLITPSGLVARWPRGSE